VRGMILAHTVPLGITTRDVAINQDIKAMIIHANIQPQYLLHCLKCMHNYLLGKVSTAAHGTKRIDMADIYNIPIPIPEVADQKKYSKVVNHFEASMTGLRDSLSIINLCHQSISQLAFNGKLLHREAS